MKQNQTFEDMMYEIHCKREYLKNIIPLPYKRFDKSLPALYKDDYRNAGYDLFARLGGPVTLKPFEIVTIPLNVATEIPTTVVGLLFQRSSTFNKWKVSLVNGVGVIDSLYCGDNDEWKAQFQNISSEAVTINNGDKLCQAVFLELVPVLPIEKNRLNNADRGGFGTTFDNAKELKN